MDMEHLNKSQIVLLTLLVSFITSIATGIVTVSLMEQAPPVIPQTINRVVERTVERIVPHETQTATVITTEKTVIVKEADLISQAVSRVRSSILKVHAKSIDGKPGDFIARGFVIADTYAVSSFPNAVIDTELVVTVGDKTMAAKVVKVDSVNSIALLALTVAEKEHTPAVTINASAVTLGQTLIAITGASNLRVESGIVTSANEGKSGEDEAAQTSFEINIPDEALVVGSAILNTDGGVIGIYTGSVKIVPASVLAPLVASVSKVAEKQSEKPVEGKTATKSAQ